MLKTYRITPAYIGNYRIEAFESGKKYTRYYHERILSARGERSA